MYSVQELFSDLELLKIGDFRTKGPHIPPELASRVKALCDMFASGSSQERNVIIDLVSPTFSFVFLWFAKEMAIQAVRENSHQNIVDGLRALAIENCKFDSRDSTVPLALLYHSAEKLRLNTNILFTNVAQMSDDAAAQLVLGFLSRPSAKKLIEGFGYQEGEDGGGFMYVPRV